MTYDIGPEIPPPPGYKPRRTFWDWFLRRHEPPRETGYGKELIQIVKPKQGVATAIEYPGEDRDNSVLPPPPPLARNLQEIAALRTGNEKAAEELLKGYPPGTMVQYDEGPGPPNFKVIPPPQEKTVVLTRSGLDRAKELLADASEKLHDRIKSSDDPSTDDVVMQAAIVSAEIALHEAEKGTR